MLGNIVLAQRGIPLSLSKREPSPGIKATPKHCQKRKQKEKGKKRRNNSRKSMARLHRIPQDIPGKPIIKMMKRQIKQPAHASLLAPASPLASPPPHDIAPVARIDALWLKGKRSPPDAAPPPALDVGMQIRHDEGGLVDAAALEPVVDYALDLRGGPAAAGAEVYVRVRGVDGEVMLEDAGSEAGGGRGEGEGRCPDYRQGVLDVGAKEGGEPV